MAASNACGTLLELTPFSEPALMVSDLFALFLKQSARPAILFNSMSDSARLGRKLLLGTLFITLLASIVAIGCLWLWNAIPGSRTTAEATAKPRPVNRPFVRPPPRLASIPWKRTPAEPLRAAVPLARTIWQNDASEPVPVARMQLAGLPWARDITERPAKGVTLQLAAWPWRASVEEPKRAAVSLAGVPWVLDTARPSRAMVKLAILPDWPVAKPATRPTTGPSLSGLQPEI